MTEEPPEPDRTNYNPVTMVGIWTLVVLVPLLFWRLLWLGKEAFFN